MVTSVFKNLVFKTSCESIEIHHWSIPHCGQPQQFNIQYSKVKIALRASVCKKYSCYPRYYLPSVSGPTANLVFKRIYKGLCPKLSTNEIYFK